MAYIVRWDNEILTTWDLNLIYQEKTSGFLSSFLYNKIWDMPLSREACHHYFKLVKNIGLLCNQSTIVLIHKKKKKKSTLFLEHIFLLNLLNK